MSTLLVLLIASLLLISHIHATLDYNNIKGSSSSADDQDLIQSSCITTLYPNICYSTFSTIPNIITQKVTTKKDVIELAVNKTKETIQESICTIEKLTRTRVTTKRVKMALDECLEMGAETLEGLEMVVQDLRAYPTKKPLHQYADDLKTLMSTAITNKETCLDALSNYSCDIDTLSESFIRRQLDHGGKMCSNVLAMIKNMTDTDIIAANNNNPSDDDELIIHNRGRKLKDYIEWPEWLSAGDRKLLGFGGVTPNVVVSVNGKGNYTKIAEAVEAAPDKSDKKYVIKIMAGVYKENVEIPKHKTNIMFLGEGRGNTIITGNKNVADGGSTTTTSATVAVMGARFLARDVTFQNTAGPSGHQAVALRVRADLSAFYRCGMEGYQDTLYVHSNRQFYVKCFVTGTVDFIFGNAAVVFQFCDIHARKPGPGQKNMVTAQGRTDENQNTGIVIQKCSISATADLKAVQGNFPTYLGRPWKEFSRTVVMRSSISDVIHKEGWHPWDGDFALDSLYYREYKNSGPGSDTSKRVTWKGWGVIKDKSEAKTFTVANFINGWTWLLSTGFPFWPGL